LSVSIYYMYGHSLMETDNSRLAWMSCPSPSMDIVWWRRTTLDWPRWVVRLHLLHVRPHFEDRQLKIGLDEWSCLHLLHVWP
jgi:hypothetical protein